MYHHTPSRVTTKLVLMIEYSLCSNFFTSALNNQSVHLQISYFFSPYFLQQSSLSILQIEKIATMKFPAAFLPLLFASLTTSTSLFSSSQMILADEDLDVPGENPLKFCQKTDGYSLTINYVDLTPNPPLPSVPPSYLYSLQSAPLSTISVARLSPSKLGVISPPKWSKGLTSFFL